MTAFVALALSMVMTAGNNYALQGVGGGNLYSWSVAYSYADDKFTRSASGTLNLDNGRLSYRATNGQQAWDITLADVISIKPDEVVNYTIRIPAIAIESREGGQRIKRLIAVVDDGLHFIRATPVVYVLQQSLERSTTSSARLRESQRNFQ